MSFVPNFNASFTGKKLLKEIAVARTAIAKLGPKVFTDTAVFSTVLSDIDYVEFIGNRVLAYPTSSINSSLALFLQNILGGLSALSQDGNTLVNAIKGSDVTSTELSFVVEDLLSNCGQLGTLLNPQDEEQSVEQPMGQFEQQPAEQFVY